MRTMSLFESQESTGVVSLGELFDGNHDVSGFSDFDIENTAFALALNALNSQVLADLDAAVAGLKQ